jgi:hypothetical protein
MRGCEKSACAIATAGAPNAIEITSADMVAWLCSSSFLLVKGYG